MAAERKKPPLIRVVPVTLDNLKIGEATIGPSYCHIALDSPKHIEQLRAEGYRTKFIEIHVEKGPAGDDAH